MIPILIWMIENQRYAINLTAVDSILLACSITPLPHAPEYVIGAINVHGQILPVVNMRQLLGFVKKEIEINDYFIVVHVHQKPMAILVDVVKEVKFCDTQHLIPAVEVLPDLATVDYVLKENGYIVLLYDLDKLIPVHTMNLST